MPGFPELVGALAAADLPGGERERLGAALRGAARADPAGFAGFVRSIPLGQENALFEVYEALAGDPETWGPFVLEELDRIVFEAKSAADPARVVAPLEALAFFARPGRGAVAARIGARLAAHLESPAVSVRRRAARLIGDFLDGADAAAVARLRRLLAGDPDWRVRYFAEAALRSAGGLPAGYRRPVLDRLLAKISNPFEG